MQLTALGRVPSGGGLAGGLLQLTDEREDHDQRCKERDDACHQHGAAGQHLQQVQHQRSQTKDARKSTCAPQEGLPLVRGYVAGQCARLAVDGKGIDLVVLPVVMSHTGSSTGVTLPPLAEMFLLRTLTLS